MNRAVLQIAISLLIGVSLQVARAQDVAPIDPDSFGSFRIASTSVIGDKPLISIARNVEAKDFQGIQVEEALNFNFGVGFAPIEGLNLNLRADAWQQQIKEFSSTGSHLWCLDIESGASTGWIATNWLEDLILHQQGPEIYDQWSNQEIVSGSDEITLSILDIGKLIFIKDAVFGGNKRIVRKEFRNNHKNLTDENNSCIFSWSGHFASSYFPKDKEYGIDYDFFKFPSLNNKEAMVGIGDALIVVKESKESRKVLNALISNDFGKSWLSKNDSTYISANMNSEISTLRNKQTIKETGLIKKSLESNLFRYDASELMERRIGSDALWYAMFKYIELTSLYIDEVTEELDFSY